MKFWTKVLLVQLAVAAAVCFAGVEIPGEVAFYPLQDGSGTAVKESKGRLPDGNIRGSFWISGQDGQLIDFGGMKGSRQARVDLPKIDFDGEFTIAVWCSAYWWKNNWAPIVYRSDATYGVRNNSNRPGQIHFLVRDKNAKRAAHLFSNAVLEAKQWYHIAVVFRPGKYMRIYIDGKLDCERVEKVPEVLNTGLKEKFVLGGRGQKGDYFTGVLCNLHFFNRALEEKEISLLYNSENRFKNAGETKVLPLDGKVAAAVVPGVQVFTAGGMKFNWGGNEFLFDSGYSFPQTPALGWNCFAAAPVPDGEAEWQPAVSADGKKVAAQGKFYRVERTVKLLADDRLRVEEKITNLSGKDIAVIINHSFRSVKPVDEWYLHGQELGRSAGDSRLPSANPTGTIATGGQQLAWVVEDDILRCHLQAVAKKNADGTVVQNFGSRNIGIPSGQSHTFAYTVYQLKGDYFDFINRLRRDWQVPEVTLPGPFISCRTGAHRAEVYQKYAADPELFKALLAKRHMGVVTLNPWFNYWDGTIFKGRGEFKAHMQQAMKTFRAVNPQGKYLASLETYVYCLREADFRTPAPAGFSWNSVTPGTAQRVRESAWYDSATTGRSGEISLYPMSDAKSAEPVLALNVHPAPGNMLDKTRMEEFDFLLDEVGFDGIYQDMFGFSAPNAVIHNRWDGFTVSVNPDGSIAGKYTHLGPLTAKARSKWLRKILGKGKLALTNFGAPTTRELQTIPYMNFCEAAGSGVGHQDLESIPPDSSGCAMNQLSTPLAYGPHSKEEKNAVQLMKRVRSYLRYGCLYIHTSMRNSLPESGAESGSYDFINHCYPMTPLELHRGWLKGKERIVTCVSCKTLWDKAEKPVACRFDSVGRSIPVAGAVTISGKPGAWEVSVNISDWREFAVVE